MKSIARPENMPDRLTEAMISRTSFTPLWMAESSWKGRSVWAARILAKVVLPTPGGPQRIMDGRCPPSSDFRNTDSSPTKCPWPK